MPELPGEPRLQLSEGCRAYIGGAICQKDYLGGNFRLFGEMRISSSIDSGDVAFLVPSLYLFWPRDR
jgi:hypothetical protein